MTISSSYIPWPMVGGFIAGGLLAAVFGCAPPEPSAQPSFNPRVVESVSTPEMIADLHRREHEFFARQLSDQTWPHPEPAHVVEVEWEPVFAPDGKQLQRTKVPGGWLVLYGDVAVIVTDSDHSWAAGR